MTLLQKANNFILNNKDKVDKTYRNKFHLMAPIGWINDPNGFIFYKDQYHLFYQYYPFDSVWGPMYWGHAASDDGVNWQDLPVALAPDKEYDRNGCFSGTAYVEDDILYLAYTGNTKENGIERQVQCIAKSTDGINFEKLEENPVIKDEHIEGLCLISNFRDPKLFKKDNIYYMLVATKTSKNNGQILIFTSNDLINWSKGKVFLEGDETQGEMWECPDVFNIDGKDVLIMSPVRMPAENNNYTNHSSTIAFIGHIDWNNLKFEVENYHEIDNGTDFYAPQTTLNKNNEQVMSAWMQMWHRTPVTHDLNHKWIGSMVLPRVLNVKGYRLTQEPISSIYDNLKLEKIKISDTNKIGSDLNYISFSVNKDESFNLKLVASLNEEVNLSYDTKKVKLSRENSGYKIVGNEGEDYTYRTLEINEDLNLEIFIDTNSIEVFINNTYTMTFLFFKKEEQRDFILNRDLKNKDIVIGRLK
ncbi:MAG: glycoside hydrolase family 32 protein [Erysipelotrichaceae bacterium]|nr:glycoside hydrolase family 32 protein [Erysipelotrichaceae bacterium]